MLSTAELLKQKKADFEIIKAKYIEETKEALSPLLSEFFDANPEVETVTWDQYAPHFNDGEPCLFDVHEMYWTVSENSELPEEDIERVTEWDEKLSTGSWCTSECSERTKQVANAVSELESVLHADSDFCEEMYGSDATVVISRDGISIEECDHD